MSRKFLGIALAGCGLLGAGSLAQAEERTAAHYQQVLEQWSGTVAELSSMDTSRAATQEVERIRSLLSQGQAFLASEKTEQIDPILERVEAISVHTRARLTRLDLEAKAAEADALAKTAEASARESTDAANAMNARFDELEAKGL